MKQQLSTVVNRLFGNLGPSRKFFLLCLSFISGVGLHASSGMSRWPYFLFGMGIIAVILVFASILFRVITFMVALVMVFIFGVWIYDRSLVIPKTDISGLNNQKVNLQALITEDPDRRIDQQKLIVSQIVANSNMKTRTFSGKLLVRTALYPEYHYGDEISFICKLQKPEPVKDFAYDAYLARWGIYSICYNPEVMNITHREKGNWIIAKILAFKQTLGENIDRSLPEPYASLARGTALGDRGTIPSYIQDIFRIVGLSHILAISGFNITIVVYMIGLLINSLTRNRKARFLATSIGIILFVIMVGADASVIRAAFMAGLALISKSTGRVPRTRVMLAASAAVMLLKNPKLFAFDIGFLLSFAATIGIIYFPPLLEEFRKTRVSRAAETSRPRKKKTELGALWQELAYGTIAAILFTSPLILYFFRTFSIFAFPVNLLVVPITPIIMILSLAIGIFAIVPVLAAPITPILYASIYYMNFIAAVFAKIPYSAITFASVPWFVPIALYGVIFYLMRRMKKRVQIQPVTQ